tara:strand:+ start:2561 stop:2746 length:186 start_codon:yes stop_codon:yes gene_type:complete
MEVFTIEEFQERWDELIGRVESGEKFGIVNENGEAAIMMPAEEYEESVDIVKLYTEHDEAS